MQFVQSEELLGLIREQNLFFKRIAEALENIVETNKSKAFNDFYKNVSTEDLAGR